MGSISIDVVRSETDLRAQRSEWNDLLTSVDNAPIFLTWEWITTWWKHFGYDKELYVLTARNEQGNMVGIAPFMQTKSSVGPLALRTISFIGTGIAYPAHLDVIARHEDQAAVVSACLDALIRMKNEWDIIELVSLAETSPLRNHLPGIAGQYREGYTMPCPFVKLPENWRAYEMEYLSSNMRQQLRRAQRQLEKDYPDQVVFEFLTEPTQVAEGVKLLASLNRSRWHEKDTRSSFDEDRVTEFMRDLALVTLEQGWLRLGVLRVADTTVALTYCFHYGDTYANYQNTFNIDWSNYSPGRLIMARVIQAAIEEGATEFDMLHGNVGAKERWNPEIRSERRLRAGHGLRGNTLVVTNALIDEAVQFSRDHVPDSVRQRIGRLLPQTQW